MRKYILSVAVLLFAMFLGMECSAAPFVYCDPFPATMQVDGFKIRIDGGSWIDVAPTVDQATGGKYIKFDLGPLNLSNGNHTGELLAFNLWGDGEVAPFSFTKQVPSAPASTRLSKQ
jgi:hypothetical protein